MSMVVYLSMKVLRIPSSSGRKPMSVLISLFVSVEYVTLSAVKSS